MSDHGRSSFIVVYAIHSDRGDLLGECSTSADVVAVLDRKDPAIGALRRLRRGRLRAGPGFIAIRPTAQPPAGRHAHDPVRWAARDLMVARYDTPLYLLAFDHRASFERGLFGARPPLSQQVRNGIAKAKEIIFAANQLAVEAGAPRERSGILVDEEFGAAVARRAKEAGVPLAMPVERSGQDEFDFAYGAAFAEHIETFDPTFTKVLVRYNPEGEPEVNRRQTERLAQLSEWLREAGRLFLFEMLVPPTTPQLEVFEGHRDDYDRRLRPQLVVEAIAALQAGGVEPDIWKVEGLDAAEDAVAVVDQARAGGRGQVNCIVLGRGASWDRVVRWLQVGAAVPGFVGFAVGRTLWHDALVEHLAGRASQSDTATTIAGRYRELIDAYHAAGPRGGHS